MPVQFVTSGCCGVLKVDARDYRGSTALIRACEAGMTGGVQELLRGGKCWSIR
jgi:hypothetical protein